MRDSPPSSPAYRPDLASRLMDRGRDRGWIEREFWWIFDDVAAGHLELDAALVFATSRVLEELNEPLARITGAPSPPSKVVEWPDSESAGIDTNRTPWAECRAGAIYFAYGQGETAVLFEPIPFDNIRMQPLGGQAEA